jgi:hypothetical protein
LVANIAKSGVWSHLQLALFERMGAERPIQSASNG